MSFDNNDIIFLDCVNEIISFLDKISANNNQYSSLSRDLHVSIVDLEDSTNKLKTFDFDGNGKVSEYDIKEYISLWKARIIFSDI